MSRHIILAPLFAAVLGLAAIGMTTPASAQGISFSVTPKGSGAKAVGTGLKVLSIAQSLQNRAKVDQKGVGNGAAIGQNGSGNVAGVFQRGNNNTATATQNGNNNLLGIFQFGKNNNTAVTQNGDNKVKLVFQGGW